MALVMAFLARTKTDNLKNCHSVILVVFLKIFLLMARKNSTTEEVENWKLCSLFVYVKIQHVFYPEPCSQCTLLLFLLGWIQFLSFIVKVRLFCRDGSYLFHSLIQLTFLVCKGCLSLISHQVEHSKRNSLSTHAHVLFTL